MDPPAPAARLACLPRPSLMRGTTLNTIHHHPIRTGLSRRTLYMVLASVAGVAVVGVLCVCLPCIIIIKQASSCPASPFGLALWQARGTRTATNLWPSVRRDRCHADGVASLALKSLLLYFGLETDLKHCLIPLPSLPPLHHNNMHCLLACLAACCHHQPRPPGGQHASALYGEGWGHGTERERASGPR